MATKKVLGIDPGTGICGFGVVRFTTHKQPRLITAGVITTPAHTPLADRLLDIYQSLEQIIQETEPDEVAIEKLFFNTNITTGITVAEARGVCILVARQHEIPIYEYTPLQIKNTLTGYGRAKKHDMQEAVRKYLDMDKIIKPDDAADAVAAAITHALSTRIQYRD
ncbi:crossover junction endodeoxyribonuclease RuvC [Candidatus Saccharibacteria bacterium]|jgi:crossover junction endodeoxyribonuclease RuvC|nr:crossover junction endodeoxyribonuclease RuvC [Candidatus Saccharibacteria bacterium]